MQNPWSRLPIAAPYVLPDDADAVDAHNALCRPEHAVRLDALPEPFLGRPDAPVVLLNLNPGFRECVPQVHADPGFRAAHRACILHEPTEYPFYLLDPRLEDTPGFAWWRKSVRQLVDATDLRRVANSLLCVEFFPYPSHEFHHRRLHVSSQSYGFELVRRAVSRDAIIVLLRGAKPWFGAIPELENYAGLRRTANPQTVSISPKNCGDAFDEIVEILERAPAA